MKLANNTAGALSFNDTAKGGVLLFFQPGDTKTIRDEDVERSPSVAAAINDGRLTKTGDAEPLTGTAAADQHGGN